MGCRADARNAALFPGWKRLCAARPDSEPRPRVRARSRSRPSRSVLWPVLGPFPRTMALLWISPMLSVHRALRLAPYLALSVQAPGGGLLHADAWIQDSTLEEASAPAGPPGPFRFEPGAEVPALLIPR